MKGGQLLLEISNSSSILCLQNWMVDTNTTPSVITVNEVSTLFFGCKYHTWLPGGVSDSGITALL